MCKIIRPHTFHAYAYAYMYAFANSRICHLMANANRLTAQRITPVRRIQLARYIKRSWTSARSITSWKARSYSRKLSRTAGAIDSFFRDSVFSRHALRFIEYAVLQTRRLYGLFCAQFRTTSFRFKSAWKLKGNGYALFDLLSQGRVNSHGRGYVVVLHVDHDLLLYG